MVRRARVEIEGGLYHVYNRISSGEDLFSDPNEAIEFVEIARDVKKRDGWTVLAWCVMSNHFHLVLRTSSVPLWRGMHGVQNRFSRGFNRRYRRTGAVWQSRYKAKYVEDQGYLGALIQYVHLNPLKAGVVEDPADYAFCGHREVKRKHRNPFVDVYEMLLAFGQTKNAARKNYLQAIRLGMDPDSPIDPGTSRETQAWHPFKPIDDRPLEVDDNVVYVDVLGRSTGLERPTLSAVDYIRQTSEILEVDFDHLVSRARDRETALNRRLIVTLGAERWRQNRTELGTVMNKNPDVVSWWVGEGTRRRMEDEDFAARFDALDRELSARLTTKEERRHERTS